MFPGEYPLNRGETLSSVIERAGGFTEIAHVEAAAFTREEFKIQGRKRAGSTQRAFGAANSG